jgi:hypothetical protein
VLLRQKARQHQQPGDGVDRGDLAAAIRRELGQQAAAG